MQHGIHIKVGRGGHMASYPEELAWPELPQGPVLLWISRQSQDRHTTRGSLCSLKDALFCTPRTKGKSKLCVLREGKQFKWIFCNFERCIIEYNFSSRKIGGIPLGWVTKWSGEQWNIFGPVQCHGQYCYPHKAHFGKFYIRTILRWDKSLMTSAMSARMSKRVTADSRARAARTMVPRFTEEHGSSANSEEAMRIVSPGRQTRRHMWVDRRLRGWQS